MSLPITEKVLDAITAAKLMNHEEGKESSVVLLHPFTLDPWLDELGVSLSELESSKTREAAPMVAGLSVVRDETIPVDEVCVLSDEDYLDHESKKYEAGDR